MQTIESKSPSNDSRHSDKDCPLERRNNLSFI